MRWLNSIKFHFHCAIQNTKYLSIPIKSRKWWINYRHFVLFDPWMNLSDFKCWYSYLLINTTLQLYLPLTSHKIVIFFYCPTFSSSSKHFSSKLKRTHKKLDVVFFLVREDTLLFQISLNKKQFLYKFEEKKPFCSQIRTIWWRPINEIEF